MCDEDVYVGWIKELIWSGSRKPGLVRLELKTGGETRSPYFRSLAPPFLCDSYLQSLFWPKLTGGGVCFTFKHFHGLVLFDQILRVHWIKPVCQREIWVRLRFHFSFPLVGVAFTGSAAAGKSKKLCVHSFTTVFTELRVSQKSLVRARGAFPAVLAGSLAVR